MKGVVVLDAIEKVKTQKDEEQQIMVKETGENLMPNFLRVMTMLVTAILVQTTIFTLGTATLARFMSTTNPITVILVFPSQTRDLSILLYSRRVSQRANLPATSARIASPESFANRF